MKKRKTSPHKVCLDFHFSRERCLPHSWQKKWRTQQMLRVSSLPLTPMLRDQKISTRCTTSSQSRNGPPWTACSPNSKLPQMTAQALRGAPVAQRLQRLVEVQCTYIYISVLTSNLKNIMLPSTSEEPSKAVCLSSPPPFPVTRLLPVTTRMVPRFT